MSMSPQVIPAGKHGGGGSMIWARIRAEIPDRSADQLDWSAESGPEDSFG